MILEFLKMLFTNFAQTAIDLLPDSPFASYLDIWSGLPYLGYVNWLIPFGSFVKVLAAWVGAISVFYVVMAILRWIKILGD